MTGLMSFWTKPKRYRIDRQALMLATAAATYLRRAFDSTELVTDLDGIRIAELLGWRFTSYALALEKLGTPETEHIWMLGKIEAQRIQTKPTCHIDLDLICYHAFPMRMMQARVAVQSKDTPSYYFDSLTQSVMEACDIPPYTVAYNMAISLFNDTGFRREYCEEVLRRAKLYGPIHRNGTVLSIVLEQALFGHMAREARIEIETAIQTPSVVDDANGWDCKLTHFWGKSKRMPQWTGPMEERFQKDFPEQHAKFTRGYARLVERGLCA